MKKNSVKCVLSFFCIFLLSCAVASQKNAKYHFQGKNEWEAMASGFRYPKELEEHIEKFLGIPYLWGGNTKEGMDCSAFVKQIYAIYGIDLPRTSALQSQLGVKIPKQSLLPGDLVFFGEAERDSVTHVGIYMGNNKFANSTSSYGVKYSGMDEPYFLLKFLFAKRVM